MAANPAAFAPGLPDVAQLVACSRAPATLARGALDPMNSDEELTRLAFAEATGFAYDLEISAMTESGRLRTRYNYDDKYYEAQIHGDISWSDVERVIIYCETDYYGELMEAAEAADHLEQFASDNGYHFPVRILRGSHAGPGGFRTSAEVFAELAPNNRT